MKYRIIAVVAVLMMALSASAAFAAPYLIGEGETLYVAGSMLADIDDVVYVSSRQLATMIGATYYNYPESKFILLSYNGRQYCYMDGISAYTRTVAGEPSVDMAMKKPPLYRDGVLYLPLIETIEALGMSYEFDSTYSIYSFKQASGVKDALVYTALKSPTIASFTKGELVNLARLLYFEARDGSILKKIAVANVVINRVLSTRFPNTIDGVIFQSGQFPPAYYASFAALEPTEKSIQAAVRALSGEVEAGKALFFNLVPFAGKDADFYRLIEGDYFYY